MNQEFVVFPDPAAVAQAAAQMVVEVAQQAIAARGRCCLALSGGSTPQALFALLAAAPLRTQIDWTRVWVVWADERHVPHADPERNERTARDVLLEQVPIPAAQILAVPFTGLRAEQAAVVYETQLTAALGVPLRLDLVLLGMGPDGHTASIFPGQPEAVAPAAALVIAVQDAPKPPPTRVSLSYAAINAARAVLFLVTGADKAAMVARIRAATGPVSAVPALGVRPIDGTVTWLLDAAAAG
jgi:6-phosphogluconolactonase